MTATLAVVAGLAASSMARRVRRAGRPALIGTLAAIAVLAPLPAAAAVVVLVCWRLSRRLRRPRLEGAAAEADVVLLADLVALGLGAGLSLPTALDEAAGEVAPPLAGEVRRLRRAMTASGWRRLWPRRVAGGSASTASPPAPRRPGRPRPPPARPSPRSAAMRSRPAVSSGRAGSRCGCCCRWLC